MIVMRLVARLRGTVIHPEQDASPEPSSSSLQPHDQGDQQFALVYSTYRQPFQRLSGFAVESKAQRPCRDRAWAQQSISSYSVYSVREGESGHGGAPPLLHYPHQSSQVPERESVHGGAPPLSCTNLLPLHHLEHLLPSLPPGSARRDESTTDSDPKWSPCLSGSPPVAAMDRSKEISLSLLFPDGCCHGKMQSDLPDPSLLKRARAPSERPPLAFSRSPLDSLLAGFLPLFLILDDFHPAHPSSDLLA